MTKEIVQVLTHILTWSLEGKSVLSQVGADFPIDELCISKSLLLNLPGKEEGPKPGDFPILLLEEPGGETKLS
jgi:hypothetical protein